MNRLAAILMVFALAGCGTARSLESRTVELGVEVTMASGETVSVKATPLKVRFVAVTEDSRCPREVTCIWAGEVKVALEFHGSSPLAAQAEIAERGSTVAGAYRVTLVRVEPHPTSTARIAPQDYRATLKIDRAD
jgi:hypothetical protein